MPSQFEVEGNDSEFIKNFPTDEIRANLTEFKSSTEIRFGNHVVVKFALKPENGRFYLSTEGFAGNETQYDLLIETTIGFYEQMKFLLSKNAK